MAARRPYNAAAGGGARALRGDAVAHVHRERRQFGHAARAVPAVGVDAVVRKWTSA